MKFEGNGGSFIYGTLQCLELEVKEVRGTGNGFGQPGLMATDLLYPGLVNRKPEKKCNFPATNSSLAKTDTLIWSVFFI